ncbi:hypothetical protein CHUAL_005447 [Chamberlinius hualienensis]
MSSLKILLTSLVLTFMYATVNSRPPANNDHHRNLRDVTDHDLLTEAYEYYDKMHMETTCHKPQPRIISVQTIHPNPSINYVTDCVVLHQCAWDSGCCPPSQVCSVKDGQEVTVDIPIMYFKADDPHSENAMMLQFKNHTECTCYSEKEIASRKA